MAENNNQTVQMTAEELAEFQAYKQEKARAAAEERVQQLRDNYKNLSEAFVKSTMKSLSPLSETIRRKKSEVLEQAAALQAIKAELLGIDGKNMPKSHQFTNAKGTARVTIGVYETDAYDDTVEEGVTIVKEYIQGLAKDENGKKLADMVVTLLQRSANGALKASRVVRLRKLAEESGDARFLEGVRIIENAYKPAVSRTYIRLEKREIDKEGGIVHDWETLPLGMTES
jgi:hypothetical protein